MTLPTVTCADTAGPCAVCGVDCWALVNGHRVHSLTCWPMLEPAMDCGPPDVRCFPDPCPTCQREDQGA